MSKPLFISASRIKKLQSCSWAYWQVYGPNPLPQVSNDGSRIGSVCHYILENLLHNKRRSYVKKIRKKNDLYCINSIIRYTKKRFIYEELSYNYENLDKVNKYCLVALNNDFYCEGGELESAEKEFRIESEEPYYKIMGYIDKQAKFGKTKVVFDYKSQKQLFQGEEITDNVQGLMYCLSALKEDPNCSPETRFIFLQFPNDPIFIFKPKKEILTGFEYFLEYCYERIKNFTEEDARSDFAADQGFPAPKSGFKGRLICGRTNKPGQLKKDGTPMWECPVKWGYDYYAVKDKTTQVIKKSYFTEDEIKLEENEEIVKMTYTGCPKYNNLHSGLEL